VDGSAGVDFEMDVGLSCRTKSTSILLIVSAEGDFAFVGGMTNLL
jgi:hypothetical protein